MKKRFLCGLCIIVFTIIFVGCSSKNNSEKEDELVNNIYVESNNEIFTSDYFRGLKEIRLSYYDRVLTSLVDMQKVCDILASLKLEKKDSPMEEVVGSIWLTLTFDDKSEKIITLTDTLTYEDNTYTLDKDISQEVRVPFNDAEDEK